MNAFARKYGFRDYTGYLDVWGRIVAGKMQIALAAIEDASRRSLEKNIAGNEEFLTKPGLLPEMKKAYEDSIAAGRKSLAEMKNKPAGSGSNLNASDLAIVRKYLPQLEEAPKARRDKK